MSVQCSAVRVRAAAFFVALVLGTPCFAQSPARSQDAVGDLIAELVQQASRAVEQRYTQPLGQVAERRRDRVFFVPRQLPPEPGTLLEAVRAAGRDKPARVIARLEVIESDAGLTECREKERVGRAHAEPGDIVRPPIGSKRLLLAPCVSLVDVAPEIPQVIGEKLRAALLRSRLLAVVDSPDAERRAEVAYLSSATAEFVSRQTNVHEVVYPVLLQTGGKMVLNVEYYSVERGRAVDIDVASGPLDDLMRAWLRAGRPRQSAPPGFRRLPSQLRAWRIVALSHGPPGQLVAVDPDSVHVLRFDYPGLRLRSGVALGPPVRRRRDPWVVVLSDADLQSGGANPGLSAGLYLFSDERRPLVLGWESGAEAAPQVRSADDVAPALELAWPGRKGDARWWPEAGQRPNVLFPCIADLDRDGQIDVVWSEPNGALSVKLAAQRSVRSFPGFGDVKAVQPPSAPNPRAVFWLTDAVWHREPDRLHQAELEGDDLRLLWSSEPFEGTIVAIASLDLNGDGVLDLAVAEALDDGTRLHAYLALGGGGGSTPVSEGGARR